MSMDCENKQDLRLLWGGPGHCQVAVDSSHRAGLADSGGMGSALGSPYLVLLPNSKKLSWDLESRYFSVSPTIRKLYCF